MKKLMLLLIIILPAILKAQAPLFGDRLFVSQDKQDTIKLTYNNHKATWTFNKQVFDFNSGVEADSIKIGGIWYKSLVANIPPFNGNRTVTRSGLPAVNVGTTGSVNEFLEAYLFPSTSPTATISSSLGTSLEFMSSGTALSVNLGWTAVRPVACNSIQTITVNSVSQTVMSPFNEGQTQTGTLSSQPLTRNTNTTYSINVVSTDKNGSASVTVTWFWKRYWGSFTSAVPPGDVSFSISDAQILALTGAGVGTGNELSTTRVKTYNGINGAGKYLVFAWPSAWGTPSFIINGLVSTAFTKVRSASTFTNASGGSTTYDVWVSNTTQASAIAQFQIN